MIKNILAGIGAATVAVWTYRGYKRYVAAPLENAIVDALDSETNRVAEKRFQDATAGDVAAPAAQ